MPLVQVQILKGRPDGVKAQLARALSDAVSKTLGIDSDRVSVIVQEVPATHWMRGGRLFSEALDERGGVGP